MNDKNNGSLILKRINEARDRYVDEIGSYIMNQIDIWCNEFVEHFPKRKLKLHSGNGVWFIECDGEMVDVVGGELRWNRSNFFELTTNIIERNFWFIKELADVEASLGNFESLSDYLDNRVWVGSKYPTGQEADNA